MTDQLKTKSMQKKWLIRTPLDVTLVDELRSKLKIDSVIAELLLQRGITSYHEAEAFFRPKLENLHDPFLMKDLDKAVDRLSQAIDNNEKVMLFGDYDVDGTTAVALLYSFLIKKLPNLIYYIPDRYNEGYGLSFQGIDFAAEANVNLIISLDCGIKSVEKIAYAREQGIDFIVCDHHTPGEVIPDALVLDPKRKDCSYPYDELSGCGVGFKLLQGLCIHKNYPLEELFLLLDLVAVSIGADIVPITGENRILCFHGMRLLNENPRPSFESLLKFAGKGFPVSLTDVVFSIAPRINAAGRLRSGKYAVELMISEDKDEIEQLSLEINQDNSERRELDAAMTSEALHLLKENTNKFTNVVYKEDWHKGVVGIVASRIMETHYKPTIVLTFSNGKITGSARSVKNFDIHEAINACSHLLETFGGHKYAAGLTLLPENLEDFSNLFEETVAKSLKKEDLSPEQEIDLKISFNQVFQNGEDRMKLPKLLRLLKQFEPCGPGNMKPVFLAENIYSSNTRILKEEHLKMEMVQPEHDVVLSGIAFRQADKENNVAAGVPFDIAFTLEENSWNNRTTLQLNIKDIRSTL